MSEFAQGPAPEQAVQGSAQDVHEPGDDEERVRGRGPDGGQGQDGGQDQGPDEGEAHGRDPHEGQAPSPDHESAPEPDDGPQPDDGPDLDDGPEPLGVGVRPTGHGPVDAELRRLEDADHLAVSGHLEVYEDVHRGLRETLAALDRPHTPRS